MEAQMLELMSRREETHWWFVARRRIISRALKAAQLPANAQILEAGCGSGGNLAMLREFGEVKAFELDENVRARAQSLGLAEVVPGRLPDEVPYADGSFDAVVAFDVLEHIEDDEAALSRLTRLLRPNGVFCATVPACAWLWSYHDVANHHFRRYERGGLLDLTRRAGLEPFYSTYFNTILFPIVAGVRLFKNTYRQSHHDLEQPSAPVNACLRLLMGSERVVVPWAPLPFGSSLLVLARRPGQSGSLAA